ncbi:hypothetical protein [Collimonas fungivorans]|uniref:hypothetical protein n=1 Tax=Collimonas fungivorans TaxID=158899 RepID=UPI0014289D44|nr:hypothetical protein [Collimonas fungivorans]
MNAVKDMSSAGRIASNVMPITTRMASDVSLDLPAAPPLKRISTPGAAVLAFEEINLAAGTEDLESDSESDMVVALCAVPASACARPNVAHKMVDMQMRRSIR